MGSTMQPIVYLRFTLALLLVCGAASESPIEAFLALGLNNSDIPEEARLGFVELGNKYGHSVEQYDVVTEDGYILTLFHLPGKKGPVLLLHGIVDSADSFLLRGNNSLAITLANSDYDTWVGNSRGNLYGRRHVTLDPDTDKSFWDFSFHEVGYYDLPATIDFVLNKTGANNLSTIGHSQGTTAHFVLGSTRPEYNDKINVFVALAPIAFLNNLNPQVELVALAGPAIDVFLKSLGYEEILRDGSAASSLIRSICSAGIVSYAVCTLGALFPFSGFDPARLEPAFLPVAFGHYPAATSRKSLIHYDQIVLGRRFCQFNNGTASNLVKYDAILPPDYDLSAVSMKVALLAGNNDQLSRIADVIHLRNSLPNVVLYKVLEPTLWSHFDFMWAPDMDVYMFPYVFEVLEMYN